MKKKELEDRFESLQIKIKHLENDYELTREEYDKKSGQYLEILAEFNRKNTELESLKSNLENIVKERTKELKESQKVLHLKNLELQVILDSSTTMIFYKNKQNKYIRVNKAFAKFVGAPIKEIIGKSESEFITRKSKKILIDESEIIRSDKSKLNSVEYLKTTNGKRWVKIDKIPYKDSEENIIEIIGFAQDITEFKRIEKERKTFQDNLIHSQKMESIGKLAGGIAHDFNNILTGIKGYAELLKMKFGDSDTNVGRATDVIIKGAERASDLTRQLLGFAREGKFNPVPLNVNEVIKEVMDVSDKILEKKVTVDYRFTDTINAIEVDKNQLDQVLTNLIINAKDAMPNGGKLEFKTENIEIDKKNVKKFFTLDSGSYVKISVSDSGIGMPKKISKRVFEPFFTTKDVSKGTGLGLATVYGIIQNHGGHISVKSELGKGATFSIYFPVTSKKAVEKHVEEGLIKGDETILIVDDEDYIRDLLKTQLEFLGYKIILARDGIEAVTIYKENNKTINLILLDMIMPKMPGKETFYKLKKINSKVKVLIISGFSKEEKAEEILNNGAMGFINKPFIFSKLSQVINDALQN